jgi:hypothetical protein
MASAFLVNVRASEQSDHWNSVPQLKALSAAEVEQRVQVIQQGAPLEDLANAIRELKQSGANANASLPVLINVLNDAKRSLFLRRLAAETLGTFGSAAKSAVPNLTVALHGDFRDPGAENLAVQAAITLGKIGPAAESAVPALAKEAGRRGTPASLLIEVAHALGEIKSAHNLAIPALIYLQQNADGNQDLEAEISRAFLKFGFEARDALPCLIIAIADRSPSSSTYSNYVEALTGIAGQFRNRMHLMSSLEILRLHRGLLTARNALETHNDEKLMNAAAAIEPVIADLRKEEHCRVLLWLLMTPSLWGIRVAAAVWLLIAVLNFLFFLLAPRWIAVLDDFFSRIKLDDVECFGVKLRGLKWVGSLISNLTLIHYFYGKRRVQKARHNGLQLARRTRSPSGEINK